jgi:hypothetical protein
MVQPINLMVESLGETLKRWEARVHGLRTFISLLQLLTACGAKLMEDARIAARRSPCPWMLRYSLGKVSANSARLAASVVYVLLVDQSIQSSSYRSDFFAPSHQHCAPLSQPYMRGLVAV